MPLAAIASFIICNFDTIADITLTIYERVRGIKREEKEYSCRTRRVLSLIDLSLNVANKALDLVERLGSMVGAGVTYICGLFKR